MKISKYNYVEITKSCIIEVYIYFISNHKINYKNIKMIFK